MFKLLQSSLLLVLICAISLFPATIAVADDDTDEDIKEIDITLSPKDTLFDISNMKPGDWAPRTITVTNSGSKDFAYHMQVRNTGETKLFNELMVEIKAGNHELYEGKLAAFKPLPARKLTNNSKEDLDITVRFPTHLGNDFQGLESEFAFVFTAEGRDSSLPVQTMANGTIDSSGSTPAGTDTPTGFRLPDTSTNLFNLMLLGTALVTAGIVTMLVRHWRRMRIDK